MNFNLINPNEIVSPSGQTAFMLYCGNGCTELVQKLIDKVDLNAKTGFGKTALMYAAESGNEKIVEMLEEAGANIHAKDNDGWGISEYSNH